MGVVKLSSAKTAGTVINLSGHKEQHKQSICKARITLKFSVYSAVTKQCNFISCLNPIRGQAEDILDCFV